MNSAIMAVCVDCNHQYSQLKEDIHHLKTELRKKDQLIDSFISIAAAQAKHISRMQSSSLVAPAARSLSSPMSHLISASAATLPWLPSMHTGTSRPESPEAEVDGHSSERELVVGAPDTTTSAAALEPPADPEVGMGMAPVHSSTPMPSQPGLRWFIAAEGGIWLKGESLRHLLSLYLTALFP